MLHPHHRLRARLILILSLSLSLLNALAGCTQQPDQQPEIRIGVLPDMSTAGGPPTVNGARLAAQRINDAGGLDIGGQKHKVVLIIEDTQNRPAEAVDAARRLISQQNVVALVGPNISRNAIPVAGVAENARIPMISPGSSNPETTAGKAYVFRVAFIDPFQGRVMARFAIEELGAATAAVLYDVANVSTRSIAEVFQAVFEEEGGQVLAFESYTTGDEDFDGPLARIRAGQPDVLFLPNYTNDVIVQGQQARQMGIEAVILGSDGAASQRLINHPELEGAYLSDHGHLDMAEANDEMRAFVAAYRQAYDEDPVISMAPLTYDAFALLFEAIARGGKADPESIRQGLSNIAGYRGLTGTITYRGTEGDPPKSVVILQVKPGRTRFHKLANP